MQHDQTRLALLLPQELCHAPRDERVANAMEAVLPQLVLLRDVLVDRVRPDMLRHRLMELAVKDGYISRPGHFLDAVVYDVQRGRVVQRCEVGQGLEFVVSLLVDDLRRVEIAPVDDTVADDGDVFLLLDGGKLGVLDEHLEHVLEGIFLAGYSLFEFLVCVDRLGAARVFQLRRR